MHFWPRITLMKQNDSAVYPYVRPHPTAVWIFAVILLFLVVDCVRALVAWRTGEATPASLLLWLAWSSALPIALCLRYALPGLLSAAYAQITPSMLVARYWGMDMEYPWQDVASLKVEGRNDSGWLGLMSWLPLVNANIKCVKVELRRPARRRVLVLWKDKIGTRIPGVPVPFIRSVRLFLREPEKFVEDARQFLTPESTPLKLA